MTSTYSDTRPAPESPSPPVPKRLLTTRSPSDRAYRGLARVAGFGSLVILVLVGVFLFIRALPAFQTMGWAFFTTTGFVTNGAHPRFGVAAELYGTVVIALIGLVVTWAAIAYVALGRRRDWSRCPYPGRSWCSPCTRSRVAGSASRSRCSA